MEDVLNNSEVRIALYESIQRLREKGDPSGLADTYQQILDETGMPLGVKDMETVLSGYETREGFVLQMGVSYSGDFLASVIREDLYEGPEPKTVDQPFVAAMEDHGVPKDPENASLFLDAKPKTTYYVAPPERGWEDCLELRTLLGLPDCSGQEGVEIGAHPRYIESVRMRYPEATITAQ